MYLVDNFLADNARFHLRPLPREPLAYVIQEFFIGAAHPIVNLVVLSRECSNVFLSEEALRAPLRFELKRNRERVSQLAHGLRHCRR